MGCERCREMLSAQLDGEDEPGEDNRTDEHLLGCVECRQWLDRAAEVTRLTRIGPAMAAPDLSAAILAALPAPPAQDQVRAHASRRARLAAALHVALGAVGAVQLILGLAQVGGGTAGEHSHAGAGLTATPGHLWHESAAWNVAVGAGFLFVGLRRNRPSGLVPMLTAFVGMLLLLSVNDLTGGRVEVPRLISHGFVILGYLIVVALSRVTADGSQPPGGRQAGAGWRVRFDDLDPVNDEPVAAGPRLRLVPQRPATARATASSPSPDVDRRAA